jgi:aspartate aminotransferase
MSLSQLARTIHESVTLKLNQTAALLREKGEPVIHLGGGEPKSKTPLDAIVSCSAVLNSGDIKYTPPDGIPALKKAIIRYTEEYYGRAVRPENVVASCGAKQAIMAALIAILDPKDEVIFPAPYWVSYPEMVKLAGGVPVAVKPEDGTFYPTVKEIADCIGSYTKAVILNSPNNPSGVMYSRDFIAEMVDLCAKKSIYLIMDDTYNRLVFDGKSPINCYDFSKEDIDASKLVVINCVSKMYAMTGFRIGWAVGSRELLGAMATIQSQQTSGPATPSQWAAVGALNGVQNSIEALRMTLENNRNIMLDHLLAFPGIRVTKPEGAFYCFPDFSNYEKSSQKLAEFLLNKVRVVTVPGKEFGMEGHLRISFCGAAKEITEGIERIRWALDPASPNELYLRIGQRLRVAESRFTEPQARLLEPGAGGALRRGHLPRRRLHLQPGPAGGQHGQAHRSRRRRQIAGARTLLGGLHLVGHAQPAFQPAELQQSAHAAASLSARPRRFRAGLFRRRRSRLPPAGAHRHRNRVAQPVRADHVSQARVARRLPPPCARIHGHRRARLQRQSAGRFHAHRDVHHFEPGGAAGHHRRHLLRRRDQEDRLHHP